MNGCDGPQPAHQNTSTVIWLHDPVSLPPSLPCSIHPYGLMPGNNSDKAEQSQKADMRNPQHAHHLTKTLTGRHSCARWDVCDRCQVEEAHSSQEK